MTRRKQTAKETRQSDKTLSKTYGIVEQEALAIEAMLDMVRRSKTEEALTCGRLLTLAHEKLVPQHGEAVFIKWCRERLNISKTTAWRMMRVHSLFGNEDRSKLERFQASALYHLAEPHTAPEIREAALERADAGKPVTHAIARRLTGADQQKSRKQQEDSEPKPWTADGVSRAYRRELAQKIAEKVEKWPLWQVFWLVDGAIHDDADTMFEAAWRKFHKSVDLQSTPELRKQAEAALTKVVEHLMQKAMPDDAKHMQEQLGRARGRVKIRNGRRLASAYKGVLLRNKAALGIHDAIVCKVSDVKSAQKALQER